MSSGGVPQTIYTGNQTPPRRQICRLGGAKSGIFAPLGTGEISNLEGSHTGDLYGKSQVGGGPRRRFGRVARGPRRDPKCQKSAKKCGGRGGNFRPKSALCQMKMHVLGVDFWPKSAFCYEKSRFFAFFIIFTTRKSSPNASFSRLYDHK